MGGSASGSKASSDWMSSRRTAGLRSLGDASVVELGLPHITRLSPGEQPTTHRSLVASAGDSTNATVSNSTQDATGADEQESESESVRLWIYGRGLGRCTEWAIVNGTNLCI